MRATDVGALEHLAFRAFPADEDLELRGWRIRSTPGSPSRRINSATSPPEPPADLDADLAAVEAHYRARRRTPLVRLLDISPGTVEAALRRRGYAPESPTSVLVVAVGSAETPPSAAIDMHPATDWLEAKEAWSRMDAAAVEAWRVRLEAVPALVGYASIREAGAVAAIGVGVVDDGWLGVYDLITDPARRRRGHGLRLMRALLGWGRDRGAARSYLQVEAANRSAQSLYARLGYREAYRYVYYRAAGESPAQYS